MNGKKIRFLGGEGDLYLLRPYRLAYITKTKKNLTKN